MAGLEKYKEQSTQLESPATSAVAVSPNDGVDLAEVSRALYIGVTGNVTVDMYGTGTSVAFVGLPAGTVIPIRVSRVYATGTTAGSIVSLY